MRVCIYGASSDDIDRRYILAAEELGEKLARRGHSLVFGGGATGLMGGAARGFKRGGGEIMGVSPRFFDVPGVLYQECTELVYCDTMRERKQIMEDAADAFVVVPGGIGTYEEFAEILTLKQLGQHKKAIALLNANRYYDALELVLSLTVERGFMKEACLGLYRAFERADDLIGYLEAYDPAQISTDGLKNI